MSYYKGESDEEADTTFKKTADEDESDEEADTTFENTADEDESISNLLRQWSIDSKADTTLVETTVKVPVERNTALNEAIKEKEKKFPVKVGRFEIPLSPIIFE